MGEKYSTANNDKLEEMTGNNGTSNVTDAAMQSASSTGPSGQNSNSGKLQNVDFEMDNTKDKVSQNNSPKGKEEMEKRREEEEKAMLTLKPNITLQLPVPLIRRPSEEGFHQVVKFTKHATRRAEAKFPERKSLTLTESSKQEKCSLKKEDSCVVPTGKDSTDQELENSIICMEQDFDANIHIQPECYGSADKISTSRPASPNINNHSLKCGIVELKSLSDELICAEPRETYETVNSIEADDLSKLQQECEGEEICQENRDLQADENDQSKTFV